MSEQILNKLLINIIELRQEKLLTNNKWGCSAKCLAKTELGVVEITEGTPVVISRISQWNIKVYVQGFDYCTMPLKQFLYCFKPY